MSSENLRPVVSSSRLTTQSKAYFHRLAFSNWCTGGRMQSKTLISPTDSSVASASLFKILTFRWCCDSYHTRSIVIRSSRASDSIESFRGIQRFNSIYVDTFGRISKKRKIRQYSPSIISFTLWAELSSFPSLCFPDHLVSIELKRFRYVSCSKYVRHSHGEWLTYGQILFVNVQRYERWTISI